MSQALEISKYSNSFVNTLSTETFRDLKKTTGETKKINEQWFKQRRYILSETPTIMDTDHVFSIPNSYGYVSHFWLEVGVGVIHGSATTGTMDWVCANLIKKVKVEIGSEIMCTYSGHDLIKLIHLANRGNSDVMNELYSIAGNLLTSSTPAATTTICAIPILVPGSNLVHDLDAFDVRSPAWPIGSCNSPMVITITMNSSTYMSATGWTYSVSDTKLKFFSYAVDGDNIANKTVSPTGLYYTWNFIKPISSTYPLTTVDATEHQFTIDNIITQGELDGIVIDVLGATENTAKIYQSTIELKKLSLKVRGNEILYEHDTVVEGKLNCLREWKCKNKVVVNANPTYRGAFYPMPLTGRPDLSGISGNIGTKGINLNLNKPTVFLMINRSGDAGVSLVSVMGIYKALYNIKNDKTAIVRISSD